MIPEHSIPPEVSEPEKLRGAFPAYIAKATHNGIIRVCVYLPVWSPLAAPGPLHNTLYARLTPPSRMAGKVISGSRDTEWIEKSWQI